MSLFCIQICVQLFKLPEWCVSFLEYAIVNILMSLFFICMTYLVDLKNIDEHSESSLESSFKTKNWSSWVKVSSNDRLLQMSSLRAFIWLATVLLIPWKNPFVKLIVFIQAYPLKRTTASAYQLSSFMPYYIVFFIYTRHSIFVDFVDTYLHIIC